MHLFSALIVVLISIMMKLDSRMFGRLNFERPLLTCTICGLLLGNLEVGLLVGAQMELATLGMMSIGASGIDMNMGSLVGCAICILSGASIETAITVAVPMTLLSQIIEACADIIRIQFTHMCDKAVENGDFKRAKRIDIVYGPILYCVCTAVPVFLSVYFGADVVQSIADVIPVWVTNGVTLGANIIAFFGFAMLLTTMVNKNTVVYFFAGFLLAAYSGLGLTAIALIGIVLALILYTVKYTGNEVKAEAVTSSSNSLDELEDLDN